MAFRLFAVCFVFMPAASAAAAERGGCLASPDYSWAIERALVAAEEIESGAMKALAPTLIAPAQTRAGDTKGARATVETVRAPRRLPGP